MKKERLDVLLVKKGLASSREKAKAIIMSGIVFVDGQREDKAGSTFDEKQEIVVKGKTLKYVSRGGLKLEKAMNNFDIVLKDKVCMDVGASTGGFTDCMMQNGAVKVYAVIVVICVIIGSTLKVDLVWDMADMFNGLMVLPNLIALLGCLAVVRKLTKKSEKSKEK